jgi:hypothetical protein
MTSTPRIPMSPEQLPQQRIHEVVELPNRPVPFDCLAGYGVVPADVLPKSNPRSPIYLAQAEWAWSPMHNRVVAYYLHRGRTHWVLWSRYFDDNWWRWSWAAVACVHKRGLLEHQAAVHLLIEFWKTEAEESGVDQFHWINESDGLSVAELMAIAREVWG